MPITNETVVNAGRIVVAVKICTFIAFHLLLSWLRLILAEHDIREVGALCRCLVACRFTRGVKPWVVSTAWMHVFPFAAIGIHPLSCGVPVCEVLAVGDVGIVGVVGVGIINIKELKLPLPLFICDL